MSKYFNNFTFWIFSLLTSRLSNFYYYLMTSNSTHTISGRNKNIICYFLIIRNNKAITLYTLVSTDYTVHTSFNYFYYFAFLSFSSGTWIELNHYSVFVHSIIHSISRNKNIFIKTINLNKAKTSAISCKLSYIQFHFFRFHNFAFFRLYYFSLFF